MSDSNQHHNDKLWLMVFKVDDHIRMSMPELNDYNYFPPVTELKYDEYKEGPGDDYPPE